MHLHLRRLASQSVVLIAALAVSAAAIIPANSATDLTGYPEPTGGFAAPLRLMVPDTSTVTGMSLAALPLDQAFPALDSTMAYTPGPRMLFPDAAPFRLLAVLVDFSDKEARFEPAYFDSLLFDVPDHPGSLTDYYQEVSYQQLDLVSISLPSQIGWQRMPQTHDFYANGACSGLCPTYPRNSQGLVRDIVAQIDHLVDFSQYDNNGDGWVDTLIIVHAGRGAEESGNRNDIWSHAWWTKYPHPLVDGVYVGSYTVQPEYAVLSIPGVGSEITGVTVGVFAHELGHAFGLPDLYDINGTSAGIGYWSLMANGSWNGPAASRGSSPAHPDAWSRAYLGFATPVNVTDCNHPENRCDKLINLPGVESQADGAILRLDTPFAGEYFLLENRQQVSFDSYLPGKGLLIWHVDENISGANRFPCREIMNHKCKNQHFHVALEQADGTLDLERKANFGDQYDTFPLSHPTFGQKDRFNALTAPNSSSYYTSDSTFLAIHTITREPDSSITAQITRLIPSPQLQTPDHQAVASSPTFSWSNIGGASGYEIRFISHPLNVTRTYQAPSSVFSTLSVLAGVFDWNVRALWNGYASDWSASRRISITSALAAAPERNIIAGGAGRLAWSHLSWAASYEIQISGSSSFNPLSFPAVTTQQLFFDLSASPALPNGRYFWRVRGLRSDGSPGAWSIPDSFILDSSS